MATNEIFISMKQYFASFVLGIACMTCLSVTPVYGRDGKGKDKANGVSLAQARLAAIVAKERRLLAVASGKKTMNEKELTRKTQDLVADYESYLADNPKDQTALILYGKFLWRVDQSGPATGMFLEADKIDPEVAVVKQQIANYLTEKGRIAEALPYLLRAVELSPETAVYHHQLGSFLFLFRDELIRLGVTTRSSNDRNMVIAFREAAKLGHGKFEYRLRYAQSFFDVANPDWEEALRVWRELSNEENRAPVEAEYLFLCQARVLLELKRREEAKTLIDRVHSPVMGATKRRLLDLLATPPEKPTESSPPAFDEAKPIKNKNSQWKRPTSDELFFDDDLKNLREIAERLEEEKLLRGLRVESVRATYDEKGRVKVSLRGLAEVDRPERTSPNL
ncbi:MAG: hypothetical protein CMI32_08455 [Opitutales bacterium]|nr:hypothetical protein [Opitutales bacterium]